MVVGKWVRLRHLSCTYVHNAEGRRTGLPRAAMRVENGHHVGMNHHYHGVPPPLPRCARVVSIDVRNIRWCSVDSVSFHSCAWPTFDVATANYIARTLWANHCRWAGVLIIRGVVGHPIKIRLDLI